MSTNIEIVNAFFKLYSITDIESITTNQIIKMAECNRSTFYDYFYDKYDLLDSTKLFLIDHVTANKDIYLTQFLGNLEDEQLAVDLVDKYADYLRPLLNKDIAFVTSYKNSIRTIFSGKLDFIENMDHCDCIEDSIAASISYLTFKYLNRLICKQQYAHSVRFLFRQAKCEQQFKYFIHYDYENQPEIILRNGKNLGEY